MQTANAAINPRSLEICRKWVDRLGLGFHPDTPAADYCNPAMPTSEALEYEGDMDRLFDLDGDPYAAAMHAARAAGILPEGM